MLAPFSLLIESRTLETCPVRVRVPPLFSLCGNTLTHIPRGVSLVPGQVDYENQPAQVCIAQC